MLVCKLISPRKNDFAISITFGDADPLTSPSAFMRLLTAAVAAGRSVGGCRLNIVAQTVKLGHRGDACQSGCGI
jgi:hypothetical protein